MRPKREDFTVCEAPVDVRLKFGQDIQGAGGLGEELDMWSAAP